jgi:hypothetical protein
MIRRQESSTRPNKSMTLRSYVPEEVWRHIEQGIQDELEEGYQIYDKRCLHSVVRMWFA